MSETYWRQKLSKIGVSPLPGEICERLTDKLCEDQGLSKYELPMVMGSQYEKQIRTTIESLHSYGVFHGDLHEGNIVLRSDEVLFIDYEHTVLITDLEDPEIFKQACDFLELEKNGYPMTIEGLLLRESEMPFI